MLQSEPLRRPAHPGLDLVEYQEYPLLFAYLTESLKERRGRGDVPALAQYRLDYNGRNLIRRYDVSEEVVDGLDAPDGAVVRVPVTVRVFSVVYGREQWVVTRMMRS